MLAGQGGARTYVGAVCVQALGHVPQAAQGQPADQQVVPAQGPLLTSSTGSRGSAPPSGWLAAGWLANWLVWSSTWRPALPRCRL